MANGTGDLATQGIFEMASKEDPRGERTVGVITKCDVTQHADLVSSSASGEPILNHPRRYVLPKTIPTGMSISRMAGS